MVRLWSERSARFETYVPFHLFFQVRSLQILSHLIKIIYIPLLHFVMICLASKIPGKILDYASESLETFFREISPIHTFVNIPALIRKGSVFSSSRAGILTKV